MSARTRSLAGCWTCRLRRKKCDEAKPMCNACAALEIECLFGGDQKPEWMDGGDKQRERAEWVKLEVKRKAGFRRERRLLLEGLEVSSISIDGDDLMQDSSGSASGSSGSVLGRSAPAVATAAKEGLVGGGSHVSPAGSGTGTGVELTPSSSASTNGGGVGGNNTVLPAWGLPTTVVWPEMAEHEVSFIMMYLDYVFPFLFPFYRPPLMHGGRGWLLALLTRNRSLLHTALGVAGHFFNVTSGHPGIAMHQLCKAHSFDEMQRQQELALTQLQRDMHDIVTRGVRGYPAESSRVLGSIVQLLTFEVAIANTGGWTMHLDAAIELYTAIMENHGVSDATGGGSMTCFTTILSQLGPGPGIHMPHNHPWSSDQAALRFFTAYLLFFDTLASTALEAPPRLQRWHQHLLTVHDETTQGPIPADHKGYPELHIDLRDFLGLQNWVLIAIGEIAALDAWKKEAKKLGRLSVTQLVSRAAAIERNLRENMATIDLSFVKPPCPAAKDPLDPFLQYTHHAVLLPAVVDEGVAGLTYVWAQSALTYLSVVVSGWQPANPEIRESVALTMAMLAALPTPACLRTCVWPFTITGCMATPEQEQVFRDAAAAMGPLQEFGTIKEALAVMENVWANRAEIEGNSGTDWDLAACLGSLRHPSLLV
ncbi:fungal-specific transcription factor domain-containing protein [Apodospora peruviana]|uniref:Fungal-specific transcription factor domain-containing protein n=1 Tax=Apodospora peruviana TaxID=516989 RepID=A0AAE0IRQ3_9PEZI|nr:fungal-specific transcription factor domain-containing protein [Apodospora peruviana]